MKLYKPLGIIVLALGMNSAFALPHGVAQAGHAHHNRSPFADGEQAGLQLARGAIDFSLQIPIYTDDGTVIYLGTHYRHPGYHYRHHHYPRYHYPQYRYRHRHHPHRFYYRYHHRPDRHPHHYYGPPPGHRFHHQRPPIRHHGGGRMERGLQPPRHWSR